MQLIGPENGLKHQKINYCKYCGKRIPSQQKYCSPQCWGLDHRISKDALINELKEFAQKFGRSPTRREFKSHDTCMRYFGSWTNAILEADLIPHRSLNQRMYKNRKCIARDGHNCNSVSEVLIDNWLFEKNIEHTKDMPYPIGKFTSDWKIAGNIFIEFFGLANDSKRYDRDIEKKKQICQKFNIKLIEIYSKDLFPEKRLHQIFLSILPNLSP